jgi:glycosyltransferase involved in cell wall biosynthesis
MAAKPTVVGAARNRWAAAQYRVDIPLAFLHDEGCIEAPLIWRTANASPPSVFELSSAGAHAVMVHNFISDPALGRLGDYRFAGIPIIASLDDLLTQVPDYNTFSRTYPDIGERLKRALSQCDRLIVSTPELAGFMSGYCADIHVIPNAMPESPWFEEDLSQRPEHTRLRVAWVGAGQHTGDLEEFATVVERTSKEVDWVFFGMCPESLRPWVREIHPMVPFEEYHRRLRELDLDLGVAPLIDNAFNRCKSHIKLLEYGAMGIPAIASDLAPYRGTPATLARNEDEWVERILAYARDRSSAIRDGERLRQWVRDEHMMNHRKLLWLNALDLG